MTCVVLWCDMRLEDWFPYEHFRPYQREMLEAVKDAISTSSITRPVLMINAPTGVGKTSCISAVLCGRGTRKVVVVLRTVSQIEVYLREIRRIREKGRDVKVSYLVGREKMCKLDKSYSACEYLRVLYGKEHEGETCPYYTASRRGRRPSEDALLDALKLIRDIPSPDRLKEMCSRTCPYEVMRIASRDADVILLNYNHVFDEELREIVFEWLDIDLRETILVVDEAHNIGNAISSINSVHFSHEETREWMSENIMGITSSDELLKRVDIDKVVEKAESDERKKKKLLRLLHSHSIVSTESGVWVGEIDPSPQLTKLVDSVSATIMLSGTFYPLDAYELYYFGGKRADKLSLPNPFPKENRLVLVSKNATTHSSKRRKRQNI
ncbi:hypothetical protein DRN72_00985 [Methanosarcinales archaeon]|nr:MAG: hypothetical protein DRN72_00985 [Methanosarcinales archaeon]